MAREIAIPYPHPTYGNDLIAKEIINGTYFASINMMVKNGQTGEERYSYVPDSPDLIEKMQRGKQITDVDVRNFDNEMIVYDRNKSLEDAVLPVYVDLPDNNPEIVSFAQCPQDLTYYNEIEDNSFTFARFNDGINKFLVSVSVFPEDENVEDGYYHFYKFLPASKTEMFKIDKNNIVVLWTYSVGNRNYFFSDKAIYSYTASSYSKITTFDGFPTGFVLKDRNSYYAIYTRGLEIVAKNLDTMTTISIPYESNVFPPCKVSALENTFYFYSFLVELKDGNMKILENYSRHKHANIKTRFEYLDDNLVTNFNQSRGHPLFPPCHRPSSRGEIFLGIKEGYVSIKDNRLFFTRDYINYVDTGIAVPNNSNIAIFEDYIYIVKKNNNITVVSVSGWSMKARDESIYILFAKNKMLDSQTSKARIGD